MPPHTPPDEAPSWFVVKLTATASLGGCLFGYDMGAISGALPQLQASFDLDQSEQEWLVSILYLGGGVGASIGGSVCDWVGRKVTIILTDIVFMLGATWLYFAGSYEQVLIGRFVVGVGVAVSGVADVCYLHECAPIEWRGSVVSVNEACISLGFLLAYIAGYFYTNAEEEEWRIIFGWAGILAAIQLLGMLRLPESPAWLAEKGKAEAARLAWQQINSSHGTVSSESGRNNDTTCPVLGDLKIEEESPVLNGLTGLTENSEDSTLAVMPITRHLSTDVVGEEVDDTYQKPKIEVSDAESISSLPQNSFHFWYNNICLRLQGVVYTLSTYRRQVYIALFLALLQQFCGQVIVLNYAPLIFSEAAKKDLEEGEEEDSRSRDWSTVSIGVVKFLVTVLVIWRIEYVGRRILLIAGTSLIAIGLLALVIAFGGSSTATTEEADNNNSYWSPLTNLKTFHLALPGVLFIVLGYSMSFGPLTWLLTSELFPTDIRGRALGASTIVTYGSAAIITRTFLSAQSILGPSKVFAVYCVITVFGLIFEYLAIPDTGEKTVEQIDEALRGMMWWKFDSVVLSQIDQDAADISDQERIEMSPSPSQQSLPNLT